MNPRLALLWALMLLGAVPASAIPLYSSREGATCISCHVDPNGGGIRNEFGFNYGKNRHSLEEEEKWARYAVTPQLNEWIRLGLDARFLYYTAYSGNTEAFGSSTFFPMQGNLRVAVTPHDQLTLVASHGVTVDQPGSYVAREIYGLIHGLPGNMYLQAGRFRLPFGLRQDDHTSFLREVPFLGYDSQFDDAGIEVGSIGPHWFAQVSLTNGGGPPFADYAETFAGKVGRTSKAFQAGLSGYHRYSRDDGSTYDRWSLYGSATRGPLTVLGEYGRGSTKRPIGNYNSEAWFAEADWKVSRAVNLKARYDELEDDSLFGLDAWRAGGELGWVPMPFVELKLAYRYSDSDISELFAMLYTPF